jgi:hypothetical protein
MTLNIQAIAPSAHVDNGIVTIVIIDRIIAPHCSLKSIGILCVEAALGKALKSTKHPCLASRASGEIPTPTPKSLFLNPPKEPTIRRLKTDCHYATTPLKAGIQCVRAKRSGYAESNVTDFRNFLRPKNGSPLCESYSVTQLLYNTRPLL